MIPYIFRVAVTLTVCFLFYKLFLQKATFYRLNRWTLLGCLLLSFVLPLVPAPRGWSWIPANSPAATAIVPAVDATNIPATNPPNTAPPTATAAPLPTSPPATSTSATAPPSTPPATTAATSPATTPIPTVTPQPAHPFRALLLQAAQLLSGLYLLGLLVFGLKFLLQIFLLCYQSFTRPVTRIGRYRIVQTDGDRGPCTFGNTIFINPSLYDPETYGQILVHEQVHVSGGHTADILLAELAVVFLWFNPFVWLYRREVENNLEFLTDRSVLEHPGIERCAYQLSLLRVSAPHLPFSITSNYNQSLLKRRIVMMNSQHSARHIIWRYFILLPLLTILVCALNEPAALAQTATTKTTATVTSTTATVTSTAATITSAHTAPAAAAAAGPVTDNIATTTIPANASSAEPAVATTTAASTNLSSVSVAATVADTTGPHHSRYEGNSYSDDFDLERGSDLDMRHGSWFLTVNGEKMEFMLRSQTGENSWKSSFAVDKSEISPYPGEGTVEFKLVREAGVMTFKGSFDGEQGDGHFEFQPDESYVNETRTSGVKDMDEHAQTMFFLLNIKKDFVRMLNRNGYFPIEPRDLVSLTWHNIDEASLKYWKNSGIEGADQIQNLGMLKVNHITPDYAEGLKKAGYTHLTVWQLMQLHRQGIDGNYVRTVSTSGDSPIKPEELMLYKMMKIDPGYLDSLRKIGYNHLSPGDIRSLNSNRVPVDYIKRWQEAGFSNVPPVTLLMLKGQNVSPDFAKSLRDMGYTDIEPMRLLLLERQGITPDFIKAFHKIGYNNIPFGQLIMLKTSGVDAAYVAKMKESGLNSTDLNKYIQLKREFGSQ